MVDDKVHQEFEAWAVTKGMGMHLARADSGLYVSRVTQNYVDCWMASRAALVVELPGNVHHTSSGMRRGCQEAIEAAGLKVKS